MMTDIIREEDETETTSSSSSGKTLFGKYQLGKLLGYGAFAKVYQARDVINERNVAIKAVNKQKVLKGNLTAHVKREISIMSGLRHPHIVRLYEVLATRAKIYFVLEFAKGGELFAKVEKGRFSEDLSRKYFQQLISAVGYCHSRGIYHRDLKPENLLLDENWDLKVTDFGLSAVKDQIRPDGMLHTLCGTPAYVAPEILAKKGYDGAKVDVWSCGVILYVMNAGYLPFNDPNLMVMYRKIYKGDFRVPKWTSPDLKRLIHRLLDINPETRITVDEIVRDPWFRKGYNEVECKFDDDEKVEKKDCESSGKNLNAFDLISFSNGFDLSALFGAVPYNTERFLTAEPPERILEGIQEVVEGHNCNFKVIKENWEARIEGEDGNFVAIMKINRLTERLVVVELKEKKSGSEPGQLMWKDKLRPKLISLIK